VKLQCVRDQTKLCAPEAKKRHAHRTGAEEPIHGSGMAPRFGILAAAGRGTGSGWRKTPKAIKETGRSQDPHRHCRQQGRSRQPGEAGLQKAHGTRALPSSASRYVLVLLAPASACLPVLGSGLSGLCPAARLAWPLETAGGNPCGSRAALRS
jgi:hypothetical protein